MKKHLDDLIASFSRSSSPFAPSCAIAATTFVPMVCVCVGAIRRRLIPGLEGSMHVGIYEVNLVAFLVLFLCYGA